MAATRGAKSLKLLSEAYANIYEQTPAQAAPAPVTNVGVPGAVSDTAASNQAKKAFDTAAMAYLKALGIDDTNIKKFLDTTHAKFSKSNATVNTAAAPSTSNYLPK